MHALRSEKSEYAHLLALRLRFHRCHLLLRGLLSQPESKHAGRHSSVSSVSDAVHSDGSHFASLGSCSSARSSVAEIWRASRLGNKRARVAMHLVKCCRFDVLVKSATSRIDRLGCLCDLSTHSSSRRRLSEAADSKAPLAFRSCASRSHIIAAALLPS
jgi:hypothetical protein